MSDQMARRPDPRARFPVRAVPDANRPRSGAAARLAVVSLTAVIGLAAFGAIVVRANDDQRVLAYVRGQQRVAPQPAPTARSASPVQPTVFFASRSASPVRRPGEAVPRSGYPLQRPAGSQAGRPMPGANSGVQVTAYAPFTGPLPSVSPFDRSPRRTAGRASTDTGAAIIALPQYFPSSRAGDGQARYCVRTCDGFYFPISGGSLEDATEADTCNRLCPAAETAVYTGAIGADITEAQSQETGSRYAAMKNAFRYRKAISKSCSCTANGFGLATDPSVYGDTSLRIGDIVMTKTGMKVFNGGVAPYRDSNFTPIARSNLIDPALRESLRKIEQASLPGKSGVVSSAPAVRNEELRDPARAGRAAETPTRIVRYVEKNRALTR